jgi:hypothetical protein
MLQFPNSQFLNILDVVFLFYIFPTIKDSYHDTHSFLFKTDIEVKLRFKSMVEKSSEKYCFWEY